MMTGFKVEIELLKVDLSFYQYVWLFHSRVHVRLVEIITFLTRSNHTPGSRS